MTKSNGIKSLKQAAKLLNKHAPDGESLAYINPEEAKLLRAHGGSGITTLAGVPSYLKLFGIHIPFTGGKGTKDEMTGTDILGNIFSRYKNKPAVYSKEDPTKIVERAQSGVGNLFQDAISVYAALRAKKEQEGLNAQEMSEFNRLNEQLTGAETEFTAFTDAGSQLTDPEYTTDVADVAAYKPIDFSGKPTPELIIEGQAEGGRIGFNSGSGKTYDDWLNYRLKRIAKGLLPVPFKEWKKGDIKFKAQGGRIGYDIGGDVLTASYDYNDAMAESRQAYDDGIKDGTISPTMGFEEWLELMQGSKQAPSVEGIMQAAKGGRIGYQQGTEDGALKKTYNKVIQRKIKMLQGMKDSGIEISAEDDKWLQEHTGHAQGGRIGYNLGGIGALNPRMGYQDAGEVIDWQAQYENPYFGKKKFYPEDVGAQTWDVTRDYASNRRHPANASEEFNQSLLESMSSNTGDKTAVEMQEDVSTTGGNQIQETVIALINSHIVGDVREAIEHAHILNEYEINSPGVTKLALSLINSHIVGDVREAIEQALTIMQFQTQGNAYGGRIGAQKGGIMPLLNLGGMEKDYRQDGGFVPIGRKEKADDVPARLSKNEFVFTADAVRAAGGGDIDQGAQRMYNVMKNLEAGGEISEQSQGQG